MKPVIYNTFKPKGINSYDVIRHFKRNLPKGYGKIGHFGTLDPFAEGLLFIAVGGAAKLNEYVHSDLNKTYLAQGVLGKESNTGDNTGEIVEVLESDEVKNSIKILSKSEIENSLRRKFLGLYLQSPPAFSAAKHKGKPLHHYARQGITIEKPAKERMIYKIEVTKWDYPYLEIRFEVSSGTYIRTLFEDCAKELGTRGLLEGLIREQIGDVDISQSLSQESWPSREGDWDIEEKSLSPEQLLPLKKVSLSKDTSLSYKNGQTIHKSKFSSDELKDQERVWVFDQDSKIIGMGLFDGMNLKVNFNFPQV